MNLVQLDIQYPIATVTLNRPDKRNAMSFALLRALISTAKTIKKDRNIRAVIITGAGTSFSSGIDLKDLTNPKHTPLAVWELIKPGQNLFQKAFLIWQTLPVPVIAAISGHCFGAGAQLALAADFRIAQPDVQFSIMESKWGLVPDMGLTHSLRGLMPIDQAKELVMTARILSGNEALAKGLVTQVSDHPVQTAIEFINELVARSPDALLAQKRVLNAMNLHPWRALRMEKWWQLKLLAGKNSRIAMNRDKHPEREYVLRQYK